MLRAVGDRPARPIFFAGGHDAITEDGGVTDLVGLEQRRRQCVAAAVALAGGLVNFHSQRDHTPQPNVHTFGRFEPTLPWEEIR